MCVELEDLRLIKSALPTYSLESPQRVEYISSASAQHTHIFTLTHPHKLTNPLPHLHICTLVLTHTYTYIPSRRLYTPKLLIFMHTHVYSHTHVLIHSHRPPAVTHFAEESPEMSSACFRSHSTAVCFSFKTTGLGHHLQLPSPRLRVLLPF